VRARVLAAGFDACATKPLDADDLISCWSAWYAGRLVSAPFATERAA
jgi:hypothetical protein